jgi:hypothetical protein
MQDSQLAKEEHAEKKGLHRLGFAVTHKLRPR